MGAPLRAPVDQLAGDVRHQHNFISALNGFNTLVGRYKESAISFSKSFSPLFWARDDKNASCDLTQGGWAQSAK